ncbi:MULTISPECIES: hypothetical protein [Aeromonas]|jgi:hypothetical protein|uniref:hypothetical protein n=1 Tax=Aeromonas TaxID=642 RepID=UPI000953F11A|nr:MULTISPECIES: hypothetical protein [Aeromonas]MBO0399143.1 hypothetical protein [Aeromonas veronii]MCK0187381.1 hypothetical protein [Aeromonas hydrophila]MDX7694371.1 hypothetical protein [Aeromonas dhakensis]PNW65973.1 hypothetical protein C2U29_18785 [Aeromonas veronii]RQM80288.1 hypothetical protein EHZ77_18790 [Aeromonas dhakensis]
MSHVFYSQRIGVNPNLNGLELQDVVELFVRVFNQFMSEGYFDEAFGFNCVDAGPITGNIKDVELDILLSVRKKYLWPIELYCKSYSEDDLLDIIEYLYQKVSKPIDGVMHSWGECGMHWEKFSKEDGQIEFKEKINTVLGHYRVKFELTDSGEVLHIPEKGFEAIFSAEIPSQDKNIINRINAATTSFRRHGASIDNRRQAVRDLADVLEYLRPQLQEHLTTKDEKDIFNIANNFGIRHHNDRQKTDYDAAIWLSWMFYFYLSTIHMVLRKKSHTD